CGGSLKQTAILDNFCWGNPDKPDRLGSLVRCSYGCYDAAKGFGTPFISGKDSLYNEYSEHGRSTAIPGTLLISAISVMEDAGRAISMYAKEAGNLIYVVGRTLEELGGSHYYDLFGAIGNNVPKVNLKKAKAAFDALSQAAAGGLVRSIHDCSEGGIAVAGAEMAFSGGLGMDLFLSEVPYAGRKQNDLILFSESNSRFIVEVEKKKQKEFERSLRGAEFGLIGCLKAKKDFKAFGLDGKVCISADIAKLKAIWREPLRW
ncbi:MAG: AIR synthase-related protein, partial [Candidatus Omnitrophota bacterium]